MCMTVSMANYHMHAEDVTHTQWRWNMIRSWGAEAVELPIVMAVQQLWEGGSG